MKLIHKDMAISGLFPFIWLNAVAVHMVIFSTDPGPGYFINAFDKLVMLSCFLLYPIHYFSGKQLGSSFVPFFVQFVFWWLFAFFMIKLYRRWKTK